MLEYFVIVISLKAKLVRTFKVTMEKCELIIGLLELILSSLMYTLLLMCLKLNSSAIAISFLESFDMLVMLIDMTFITETLSKCYRHNSNG